MSNRRRRHRAGQPVPIRESAAKVAARIHGAPVRGTEPAEPTTLSFTEATTGRMVKAGGTRRYRARLIEGDRWGSSGYYPRKVVERDGPTTWPAGTLMYVDHPTLDEQANRPERSIRDLAATIVTTPVYEGDGLYADVEVFPHAAPLVEAMASTIGLSVRGEGTAQYGTIAGRSGPIIESLDQGYSVDFVTRAGAGGALVSLLEASRGVKLAEGRNVGAWLESRLHLALTELGDDMYGQGRLTRQERITLSAAIGDALQAWTARVEADAPQLFERDLYAEPEPDDAAGDTGTAVSEAASEDVRRVLCDQVYDTYGAPGTYIWVRDYDADRRVLWFDISPDDDGDQATYQQSYAIDDQGAYSLTGDRVEVLARTVYQPVTPANEDVAESATPPATTPASTTIPVLEGAQPTAPTREESPVDPAKTGTTPGTGPAAVTETAPTRTVLGEAERLSQLLAESRTALAEANVRADKAEARATVAEKRATLIEAQRGAEKVTLAKLAESDLKQVSYTAVVAGVCDSLELNEAGKVEETKLSEAIAAEILKERTRVAQLLEAHGFGTVAGLNGAGATGELSEADFEKQLGDVLGNIGLSESEAKTAARGRS
jgi:hypothetical protein